MRGHTQFFDANYETYMRDGEIAWTEISRIPHRTNIHPSCIGYVVPRVNRSVYILHVVQHCNGLHERVSLCSEYATRSALLYLCYNFVTLMRYVICLNYGTLKSELSYFSTSHYFFPSRKNYSLYARIIDRLSISRQQFPLCLSLTPTMIND